MQTERRQFPRKPLKNLAYINIEPNNGGIVVDVSEGGLRFHSAGPVPAEGQVKFWFSVNSTDHLNAIGELVWTDDSRKTGGIRFIELPYDVRAKLRSLLGAVNFEPAANTPPSEAAPPIQPPPAGSSAASAASREALAMEREMDSVAPLHRVITGAASAVAAGSTRPQTYVSAAPRPAPAAATTDAPRANIMNSPLSLLASEDDEYVADLRRARSRHVVTGLGDLEDRRHGARPFLVLLLLLALVAGGYYVYRWKTDLNASASQRLASPPVNMASTEGPASTATTSPVPNPGPQPAGSMSSTSATSAPPASPSGPVGAANPSASSSTSGPTLSSGGDLSAGNGSAAPSASPPSAPASSAAPAAEVSKKKMDSDETPRSGKNAKEVRNVKDTAVDAEAAEAEVDEARQLLHGTNGRRDPSAAVRLLWKAVGDGSIAAELELAGIYERGDGVPKNCEQARVLLRAATTHGSETAAQELAALIRRGCR